MPTSNSRECFTDLIGHEIVGVLFQALPLNSPDISRHTTTIVLDDGTGFTFSHKHGAYWRENAEDIERAVARKKRELDRTAEEIQGVVNLANALVPGARITLTEADQWHPNDRGRGAEARPALQPDPEWIHVDGCYRRATWDNDTVGVTTVGEMRDRSDLDHWEYASTGSLGWRPCTEGAGVADVHDDDFPIIVRRRQ